MACQAQKPVAVAAFGEVQGHRALIFGVSHDGREKRWTGFPHVVGLAESISTSVSPKSLRRARRTRRVAGARSGEPRPGKDADPNDHRTDSTFFFIHPPEANGPEANGIYRRKKHLEIILIMITGVVGVHNIYDFPPQGIIPDIVDRMAEDGPQLRPSGLSLRASARGPLLRPRSV